MCGIFAQISFNSRLFFTHELEKIVTSQLNHRGPDQFGVFNDNSVWMSNQRLAIVGGVSNTQPISDRDKKVVLSFNGEIYNFQDLRKAIASAGVNISESGDTPVLLQAYLLWGNEFVSKLDGQFAIIIYDRRLNKIFAFRDRFGEKPLYFSEYSDQIIISSEVSPIVDISKKNELNMSAICDLLLLGYIQDPDSIYRHISTIPAGHFLTVSKQKTHLSLWDSRKIPGSQYSDTKLLTKYSVKAALITSISERIPNEVSSALLLSGGIDSTLLAILAKEIGYNLNHLTTSFNSSKFDESATVRKIISRYNLQSTIIDMSPPSIEEMITILAKIDEPIAEPSFFAAYKLGQIAGLNNHKVVINGDGSDELFGGYPTYQADLIDRKIGFFLRPAVKLILKYASLIPDGKGVFGNKELLQRFDILKYNSDKETHFAWRFNFRQELIENIFPGLYDFAGSEYNAFRFIEKQNRFYDNINSMMYIDQYTWLTSGHLRKADRAFMLNSIESRSPFLSNRIVNISDCLPSSKKVDLFKTKKILRSILEDYVSKDISGLKKRGWTMPVSQWFKSAPETFVEPILNGVFFRNFMSKYQLEKLTRLENKNVIDQYKTLWSMIILEIWLSTHSWSIK